MTDWTQTESKRGCLHYHFQKPLGAGKPQSSMVSWNEHSKHDVTTKT